MTPGDELEIYLRIEELQRMWFGTIHEEIRILNVNTDRMLDAFDEFARVWQAGFDTEFDQIVADL